MFSLSISLHRHLYHILIYRIKQYISQPDSISQTKTHILLYLLSNCITSSMYIYILYHILYVIYIYHVSIVYFSIYIYDIALLRTDSRIQTWAWAFKQSPTPTKTLLTSQLSHQASNCNVEYSHKYHAVQYLRQGIVNGIFKIFKIINQNTIFQSLFQSIENHNV